MNRFIVGLACFGLVFCSAIAHADTISRTLPEFTSPYHDDGKYYDTYTVGTFRYDLTDRYITSAKISGQWGNSVWPNTANNLLYVDNKKIADTRDYSPDPYYYITPWTYTFSDFSILNDGKAVLKTVQTTEHRVELAPTNLLITTKQIPESRIFGVFVGVQQGSFGQNYLPGGTYLRSDKDAKALYNEMQLFHNYGDARLLTGDTSKGGVSPGAVINAINDLKAEMRPNDTLIVYVGTHGLISSIDGEAGLYLGGNESDRSSFLTVDALTNSLKSIDDMNKWVFIDACHSGAFLSDNDPDSDDLNTLKKIGFIASAEKDALAHWEGNTGRLYWSLALEKAFSMGDDGLLKADSNKNGLLDFDEIKSYMLKSEHWYNFINNVVYEAEFGDPVIFTADMWNPAFFKTDDLESSFFFAQVPEPSSLLFAVFGLFSLVVVGLFRRTQPIRLVKLHRRNEIE